MAAAVVSWRAMRSGEADGRAAAGAGAEDAVVEDGREGVQAL